jgi:hypothetical protein
MGGQAAIPQGAFLIRLIGLIGLVRPIKKRGFDPGGGRGFSCWGSRGKVAIARTGLCFSPVPQWSAEAQFSALGSACHVKQHRDCIGFG